MNSGLDRLLRSPRKQRQQQALKWALDNFGPIAANRDERAARLVEEAIEVAQAERVSLDVIIRIAERVYARPPGELGQEIGGVGLTLDILAENAGHDAESDTQQEFERVRSKPRNRWQRKHREKVAAGTADLHSDAWKRS